MRGDNGRGTFTLRTRLMAGGFILVALVCVSRLYYLQIIKGADYAARADRSFTTPSNPLFDRGTIYFTTKDGVKLAAATDAHGVSLAVQPPKIADPEALYETLNTLVPLDKEDFLAKATRQGTQYVVVANHLSTTTGARLQALHATGTVIAQDSWRQYPGSALAAQTVGFVGWNGDKLEGRYGLEKQYEQKLERSGESLYTNFFVELFADVSSVLGGGGQGDVVTTIEPTVQAELERQLNVYLSQWHPEFAGGIIMDAQTGAIYAMAQQPGFDLNTYGSVENPRIYANTMVQNVYEMGSILKPLTMAAGIDAGAVTEQTEYNDTGCITVDTAKICNYDLKARGVVPMQEILSQSLNVGASFVATKLGPERMRDYFVTKYAIGQKTGIDLPSEQTGLIKNLQSPRQLDYDEASFGQGIAMTPIATVRALNVLASGGKLVTPHIARAIRTDAGYEDLLPYAAPVQVIATTSAETVSRMLTTLVDTKLANGAVKMTHWSIAAKTGTAQIANPAGGGYYTDVYLHSYFGYVPSYHARFIIFLFGYKPVGAPYASETWSTIFKNLIQFLINYYDIPPDR